MKPSWLPTVRTTAASKSCATLPDSGARAPKDSHQELHSRIGSSLRASAVVEESDMTPDRRKIRSPRGWIHALRGRMCANGQRRPGRLDDMHRTGVRAAIAGLLLGVLAGCGGTAAPALETSVSTSTAAASTTSVSTSAVTAPPLTSSAETSTETPVPASTEPPPLLSTSETPTPEPPPVTEPPPATEQPRLPPEPAAGGVAGRVVVIDPGHNGANGAHPEIINQLVDAGFGETKPCNTTGTSTNDGYTEASFNWKVANYLRPMLESQGITVVMTRDSNDGVG